MTTIFEVCRNGDHKRIREMIAIELMNGNYEIVNSRDYNTDGYPSLLYIATKRGYRELVQELLKHGTGGGLTNPNLGNLYETPLNIAVQQGFIDIVRDLINSEGRLTNINKKNVRGGYTPLHTGVLYNQIRIIKLLLENGADFSIQNDYGVTPKELAIAFFKQSTDQNDCIILQESIDLLQSYEDLMEVKQPDEN